MLKILYSYLFKINNAQFQICEYISTHLFDSWHPSPHFLPASVFQYMDIFESPCIETRRSENMNSFALQNLRVSLHKDLWISVYWNTEIQKSLCLNHKIFGTRGKILSKEI